MGEAKQGTDAAKTSLAESKPKSVTDHGLLQPRVALRRTPPGQRRVRRAGLGLHRGLDYGLRSNGWVGTGDSFTYRSKDRFIRRRLRAATGECACGPGEIRDYQLRIAQGYRGRVAARR